MPTTVEVPNVGIVEFPDSMQPEEIQAALQKGVKPPQYGVPGTQVNTPQVAQPAPIAPSPLVSQSESYMKGGVNPELDKLNAYDPNALGPIVSQIGKLLNIHPSIPEPSKETVAKWSPTTQRIVGGALGIGEGVASQLTPANAGLVLTGAGLLKAYPAIAPLIKGALPMLFGASMVKQGAQQLGEVAGTPANQTTPLEQAKKVGEGVTTGVLGVAGMAEPGVTEIKKPEVSITKEPVISPEQLAKIKAAQPQYQQVDTTLKAKQIPAQLKTPEKELQGREMVLTGPYLARNAASEIGFEPSKAAPEQTLNRLQNLTTSGKLSAAELDIYKKQGLEEKLKEKPSGEELAKWMQEKGPRVEIVKKGAGTSTPETTELANLRHKFDTLNKDPHDSTIQWTDEQQKDRQRMMDLEKLMRENPSHFELKQSHWQSIAPKPESQMPGYVEGAVVLPDKSKPGVYTKATSNLFPESHSFPPNTLGFFRGYMEGDTFHVIEVQSDWAAKLRDREDMENVPASAQETLKAQADKLRHPLLQDYERLTLKAAIQHAIDQGAKHIALSDAETAMMTEGHDRLAYNPETFTFETQRAAQQFARTNPDLEVHEPQVPGGEWEVVNKTKGKEIQQAPGMRLHYDTLGPRLLKELTGSEGAKVNFGEHKMAFDPTRREVHEWAAAPGAENITSETPQPRKDLIFREGDKPKTSITARSYDLSKVKERDAFSLFDKDKTPTAAKQAPQQFPAERRAKEQLGLTKPSTAGDVARHIAERGDATTQQKEFASFLDRHFSHILDFAGVESGENPYGGRAAYIYSGPDSHKIYMDLKENGYNAVDTFLHEAAHAAMHWVYENPATSEQRLAKANIDKLMGLTVDSLPKAVNEFFNGQFQKELAKNPQMSFDEIQTMFEAHGLNVHKWYTTLYALQDGSEFIAGVFGDHRFREFLDNIRVENKDSIFRRIYSAIMSALGIKPGTALEKSFDTFMQMGEGSREKLPGQLDQVRKRFVGEVGVKHMPQLPSEDKGGLPAEDVIWLGDSLFTDIKGPKTWREGVKQKLNQIAGVSAPKTMASSKEAGNALVRYASARIAAPLMAKAAVSEVAGEHWNDQQWMNKFGAVLVEDRLRAIRDTFIENDEKDKAAAVRHIWEQEDSPIKTDAEFKAALKDPVVQSALQRFEKIIGQPTLERQKQLGGKIAASGPESGAFVNLRALQDAEGENIADYALSGGSKKGDLTNPLKRGSVFNKEAKGTARQYDFNFRSIAERMVQGNYEESTKRDLYDTYVKAGLSKAEPAEGFQKITIDKGRGRTENRYFRHDIAGELRQALQTDSPIEKGARQFLINRLTDVQLAGPVDVTVHIRNIFSAIAGSQGGGESVMADLARKVPGIRGLDTMVRLAKATKDTYLNTPDVQKELAKIAEIGAGRGEVKHVGALGRILPTGKIVQVLDRAGRLTLSRMYDNLVERGWTKESEEGRREFVNKMGQYNSRLMSFGRIVQVLKDYNISPFIVAGKNFNRLALQRLTLNPGVEAANPSAALKMKLVDAVGLVSTLMAIPMVFNYYNTGSIWGRPGIHPGAIDLGKDDEKGHPKQLDLVQNILVRRGLRNIGAEAAFKDLKQGRAESDIIHDAIMDMARGYASPYEGPGVRFAATALTGRDTSGYLVSENPDNLGDNLLAALKSANPSIAKLFQAKQEGTSKASAVASPLIQATGYSVGRKPSLFEQEQQVPGLEKQSIRERAATQKTFQKQDRTDMTQQQKLELSMDEAKRAKQVEAQVQSSLKPETESWLKKQHLQVPGFSEYLTQTGVRVYLLPKERQEYMQIMVSSYEDAIRKAKPFVERQTTQEMKEKVLQGFIKSAHGIARNKMRNLIGKDE